MLQEPVLVVRTAPSVTLQGIVCHATMAIIYQGQLVSLVPTQQAIAWHARVQIAFSVK